MEPQFSFTSAAGAEVMPTDAVAALPAPTDVPSTEFAPEVPVVAPQQQFNCENINVFPESISMSSSENPEQAVFDIVLSVSWTCPQSGEYQTTKLVKSIGFNKLSLINQTNSQPVSIVEAQQEKKDNSKLLRTMRELAGVAGKDTFV